MSVSMPGFSIYQSYVFLLECFNVNLLLFHCLSFVQQPNSVIHKPPPSESKEASLLYITMN